MSFATSSLGASLCFLVCFTSHACISPLEPSMEPKNLIETVPLDVWHEILKHLNGYDKCLNYLSRFIALPTEAYDTIARELVIAKEDLPLVDEIDSWITQYFNTTHYQPLRQSMQEAFIRIMQHAPNLHTIDAKIKTLDSIKDTRFMIGLSRYYLKFANQNIVTRLANNAAGLFIMIALAALFVVESVQSTCSAISDTTLLCQLSLPVLFILFVYAALSYTVNSNVNPLLFGITSLGHSNSRTAIARIEKIYEFISGTNVIRAILEQLVEKKLELIVRAEMRMLFNDLFSESGTD